MPDFEELFPCFKGSNGHLRLMLNRISKCDLPNYKESTVQGITDMQKTLAARGGYAQQDRMIKDKRRSLDRATLYSYQAALIKKQYYDFTPAMEGEKEANPVRALINPDKVKQDYDEKILSTGYENNIRVGDVFEWCNTGTYWLVYLQDLTELAYFRANIRRCTYEIQWEDENGHQRTYIALRGPVETKIDFIQKHSISIDNPNYTLNILMPKTTATLKKFKRYSKFYLQGLVDGEDNTCWRVEAIDSFSSPGILEVNATEYFANETEDDLEKGLVGALITKPIDPNKGQPQEIVGEVFIKPKKEYIYSIDNSLYGSWYVSNSKFPIILTPFVGEDGRNCVKVKWNSSYSGQFDLWFGDENGPLLDYKKTIVVQSLF